MHPVEFIKGLDTTPDAIFMKISDDYGLILQNQLTEAGLAPNEKTILITNQIALENELYWDSVDEGSMVVVPRIGPWFNTITDIGLNFAQLYQDTFNRWPEAYAFEAYDSFLLMADAMNRAGSLDANAIIKALEETDVELASGRYYFPYGSSRPLDGFVAEFMWHQWPDVPLLFLQYTEENQMLEDMVVLWPPSYRTIEEPIVRPKN